MTNPTPTNWRALCAELHAVFNTYAVCQEHHQLLVHTAAALAQPEPQGPTDEELEELADVMNVPGDPVPAMRRALELWGRPAIEPVPQQEAE